VEGPRLFGSAASTRAGFSIRWSFASHGACLSTHPDVPPQRSHLPAAAARQGLDPIDWGPHKKAESLWLFKCYQSLGSNAFNELGLFGID
jgi:hypothetical protein